MPRWHSGDQAREGQDFWETAMPEDIVLSVDYHDQNCVIRRRALGSGTEELLSVPTTDGDLRRVLAQARASAGRGGRVIWIQESTTGWARVEGGLGDRGGVVPADV